MSEVSYDIGFASFFPKERSPARRKANCQIANSIYALGFNVPILVDTDLNASSNASAIGGP
jgi:hypothetical protein